MPSQVALSRFESELAEERRERASAQQRAAQFSTLLEDQTAELRAARETKAITVEVRIITGLLFGTQQTGRGAACWAVGRSALRCIGHMSAVSCTRHKIPGTP